MSTRPDSTPISHQEAAKAGVLFVISVHQEFVAAAETEVSENGVRITRKGIVNIGRTDAGEALLMNVEGLWRAPLTAQQIPDLSAGLTPLDVESYMNHVPEAMNAMSALAQKQV